MPVTKLTLTSWAIRAIKKKIMIKSKNGCIAFTTTCLFCPFNNRELEQASIRTFYGNHSSPGSMKALIGINLIWFLQITHSTARLQPFFDCKFSRPAIDMKFEAGKYFLILSTFALFSYYGTWILTSDRAESNSGKNFDILNKELIDTHCWPQSM